MVCFVLEYRINQGLPEGKIWADFHPKTAISLQRCAMIEKVFIRYNE
jgi:hypothetical protein